MPRNGWRGTATLGGSSKCEFMWEYWIYLWPRLRRHARLTLLLVALQLAAIECLAWYLPT